MTASASTILTRPGPELLRQIVVIIGGSAGIGLETARRARAEGASIILTGRNRERLERAARELGAAPRPSMPTILLPCSRSFRICRARLTMLW